jgi:hypothetical protein
MGSGVEIKRIRLPLPAVQEASPWLFCLLAGTATLFLQLWLLGPVISSYFPTDNELALIAESTRIGGHVDPISWLTDGFHNYFLAYPEWQQPWTDFMRPLANFMYWLSYREFADHWSNQLILGYIAHALTVALTAYIALRVFRLSMPRAFAAVLVSALNPAFWECFRSPYSIPLLAQFPSCQTEIFDALLMMGAFVSFVRKRFGWFSLLATLAVFLKETALTVPVSALLLAVAWRVQQPQSLRNFVCMAAPLVLWMIARLVFFQYGGAIYVMDAERPLAWLATPVRNLLVWPTGLYTAATRGTMAAAAMHDWRTLSLHILELGLNAAWWLALGCASVRTWFLLRKKDPSAAAPQPWIVALVFVLGNLTLVILLQVTQIRYGYFWFALGPAAVFAALPRRREAAVLAMALAAGLALPQAWRMSNYFSRDSIASYRVIKQSARQLTALLAQLPDRIRTVYVIDDIADTFSSPEYLARFSNYPGRVVLVDGILPVAHCKPTAGEGERYHLWRDGATTVLDYRAPGCFEQQMTLVLPQQSIEAAGRAKRGDALTYYFPELSLQGDDKRKSGPPRIGNRWTLYAKDFSCVDEGACLWLGFDARTARYYPLKYERKAPADTSRSSTGVVPASAKGA